MKTVTALALIAVGAIFAFAVNAQAPGVNLQVLGFIVMLAGLVGLFVPSRASGWLRRRVIVRRGATAPGTSESQDVPYSPPYLVSDPAIMASQLPEEAEQADHAAAARAAAAPDDTLPDRPVGQASAARVRRSPAAAVLHDLFND